MRWLVLVGAIVLILVFIRPMVVAQALVSTIVVIAGLGIMAKEAWDAVKVRAPQPETVEAFKTGRPVTPGRFPRVTYWALVRPGAWPRTRLVTELSSPECLARVDGLRSKSVKVRVTDQGYRLAAKGPREYSDADSSWTPEIVFAGTLSPHGSGTAIDRTFRWPRSWEAGYVFVYVFLGFLGMALVGHSPAPSADPAKR